MNRILLLAVIGLGVALANQEATMKEDGHRVKLDEVRTDHGGLISAHRSTSFSLKASKPSSTFFFMDVFSAWSGETRQKTSEQADLARKAAKYERQQLAKEAKIQNMKFGSSQRKLGVNDQSKMFNFENQLYYGPLYIGSTQQKMNLIFDTGSDWLMVEGIDCKTCEDNKYN